MAPSLVVSKIEVLSKDYWKRPPVENQGDAKIEIVYTAVGRALSQWERCEIQLATLFLTVCEANQSSSNPVRRAFGTIESSAVRRTAIDEAAEVHFGRHWDTKIIRTSFRAITVAAMNASKRRDDIAHGIAHELDLSTTRLQHRRFATEGAREQPPNIIEKLDHAGIEDLADSKTALADKF